MSEDNPHSSNGSSNSKSWFEKIGQIFTGEPQNKEQLQDVFEDAAERDLIDIDTKSMIEGVLDISEMRIRDIMVPRSQMVTIDVAQSVEEFLPLVIESAHSRFPVTNEDLDHVEGFLLAKDLIEYGFNHKDEPINLVDILRPAVIVPESKRVDSMLKEFRDKRSHMAIVVDEFGGVSGLVTIEDILEIIVGEIEDETDNTDGEPDDIRRISDSLYAVSALTEIADFNRFFNSAFEDEDADTVAGLVLHSFGHMPERGETTEINGYQFKVTQGDSRRILQLQVSVPKSDQAITEANLEG